MIFLFLSIFTSNSITQWFLLNLSVEIALLCKGSRILLSSDNFSLNHQLKFSTAWSALHLASPCSVWVVAYSMVWEMLTLAMEWSERFTPIFNHCLNFINWIWMIFFVDNNMTIGTNWTQIFYRVNFIFFPDFMKGFQVMRCHREYCVVRPLTGERVAERGPSGDRCEG